jgi:hypothetical protein
VDASVHKWDEILEYLQAGGDKTYGFLQLAESDLGAVADKIACPYCRKQIATEVKLLGIALKFAKLATEWEMSKGLRKKLGLIDKAFPLIMKLSYLELTKIL